MKKYKQIESYEFFRPHSVTDIMDEYFSFYIEKRFENLLGSVYDLTYILQWEIVSYGKS